MNVNLKSLIGKMNNTTRSSLEAAAGLCLSRTHYDIEIEHFLTKLMDHQDSDLAHILKHFGVDKSRFTSELNRALDKLKTGNARTPSFSPHLAKLFTTAWTIGSVDYNSAEVRSGFTIIALLSDEDLSRIAREFSRELLMIQPEVLRREFTNIVAGSPEEAGTPAAAPTDGSAVQKAAGGKTPNLDQYTVNLTENAKLGKIDTVLGRDSEIRQIIDILMRRRQNNPILTGEAGVGKTAVVEGFAMRVANGDVPPPLRNVVVRTLDLALLQAGAGIKGEFENRLKGLIEEVKKSPVPIILFIDEAHTMIGAGGQAGQNDAANLLKPALARGELRTIAATTWSEYKKYFEKDPALARRFQVVKVEEPTEAQCMVMMRGIVGALEKHHKVRILDEGVSAAVKLSHRYLAGRQLPDKAVSVLDTACARLALGQNAMPAAIEDLTRQIDDLDVQERILRRESATGADHGERIEEVIQRKKSLSESLNQLSGKWDKTKALVEEIRDIRGQLEAEADGKPAGGAASGDGARANGHPVAASESATAASSMASAQGNGAALREKLAALNAELDQVQGENALMQVCVDGLIVGQVISGWTGIPVGKMIKDEIATVLEMERHLERRVIGQNHSLAMIGQRIQTGRASLDDPGKPLGVFMLVGPSGVGKTETALALSDLLYGGEHNLITINMSEFQEAHTVSTLKGSPPGYVGYGEGGVLTEAVRRRPYSVVLLDEVEKAHPDVLELFYQVFDKGMMEDGEGREIDFKNTIILLTTNACTDQITKLTADPETMPSPEGIVKAIKPELNKIFKPAFLGRMVVVPYYPIRDETLKKIVELKLGKIKRRMFENHKIHLQYDQSVVEEVAKRCTEVESGARNVDNILTNTLLPDISRQLLTSIAEGQKLSSVRVGIGADGSFQYA
ncbi:MAG: type VI secretion system ATPase TssH [Acidobacteriaceae bacterium]|nr:type VI secretion system ATPase TssH [Acidobacteriaceae bacterium]MBV9766363.1 type VI secretion system ATPase TssH [Acidobacteriaceae bacterium]